MSDIISSCFVKWGATVFMASINEIRDLIYKAKYDEATASISKLLEIESSDSKKSIQLLNLYSTVELKRGNVDLAEEKSNEAFEVALEYNDGLSAIESLRSKIEALLKMAQYDKLSIYLLNLKSFIRESEPEIDPDYDYKMSIYLHLKGAIERYNGNFQLAILNYQESLQLSRKIGDIELIGITSNHLGIAFDHLGDYDNSIYYYNQALQAFEEIGYISYLAGVSMNVGLLQYQMSNHTEALKHYDKSIQISEELEDETLYYTATLNLGLLNIDLGNLQVALDEFKSCLTFFEKNNNESALITVYMNMGIIYDLLWDFENALDSYEQAAFISRRIGEKVLIPKIVYNMGLTYINTQNYQQALENFEEVLKISKHLENKYFSSQIMYQLIVVAIALNDRLQAENKLKQFKELKKYSKNMKIEYLYKLAKSIFLNSSDRIADKVEAQKLLAEIIDTKEIEYEILMEATLLLSEFLVKEFEWTRSEDAISELNAMLARLTSLSTENPSPRVKIEILILQSKTAFVLQDVNLAIISLNKAEAIAERENLAYLMNRVHDERVSLENNVQMMKELGEKASQMIELNNKITNEYIEYVQRRFKHVN